MDIHDDSMTPDQALQTPFSSSYFPIIGMNLPIMLDQRCNINARNKLTEFDFFGSWAVAELDNSPIKTVLRLHLIKPTITSLSMTKLSSILFGKP